MNTSFRQQKRAQRHKRVRAKVIGSETRPRLSIYKSNTRLVAQLINDAKGMVLAHASSAEEKGATPKERAEHAAQTLAKRAKEKGVTAVVFDRGGFQYLGTVKAFADAARAAGLDF
ncbi:50S ribosomal protein L18 [Candidatus Parcubacteria bacterium]|nr:MAG: 50S ribosomal protein L18 [Candidatus Parcubacteria bacterium]